MKAQRSLWFTLAARATNSAGMFNLHVAKLETSYNGKWKCGIDTIEPAAPHSD
jgi:hypothetical protein